MKKENKNNSFITGNDILELGYPENELIGIALKINKKRTGLKKHEMLEKYAQILKRPEDFENDLIFSSLSLAIIKFNNAPKEETIQLITEEIVPSVFGKEIIEEGAILQMNIAMKLPVTVHGALMPDAHQGYGLPIGGVLATRNAIIPYGVGVDIGCRMALSIFDTDLLFFEENIDFFKKAIVKNTLFGAGHGYHGQYKAKHNVMENFLFNELDFVKQLKDKAHTQLGSSGGGNHFVEFGIMSFLKDDAILNIKKGNYLSLLTHSGSRGFGATIAGHYTKIAKQQCKLPYNAQNLAYLDLQSSAGAEYWTAMNLAGDYASACHEVIHQKIHKFIGSELLVKVENHHNFAWKEIHFDEELIVHRKGATPAGKGVMGIIPGSMTAPGFLVRGKGETSSLASASHGAGRQMSRTKAQNTFTKTEFKEILTSNNVELIGAGLDEVPMAYKNIHEVMQHQTDLIEVVGAFNPRIVRMAEDGSRED